MTITQETQQIIRSLIEFDTTSDRSNLDLISHVTDLIASSADTLTLNHNEDGTKANLVATIGPQNEKGGIVLAGHTDTVPVSGQSWSTDPYTLVEENGRLYGRGTCDMKAFCGLSIATFIDTARNRKSDLRKPLSLVLTYDEEVGCFGAKKLVAEESSLFLNPDLVLIGEPTSLKPAIAHKGIRCFEIKTKGHSCHSSNPEKGVSAIQHSNSFVTTIFSLAEKLKQSGIKDTRFEPSYSTVNVGTINGGNAVNTVPDECIIIFETRTVPGENFDIRAALEAKFADAVRAAGGELLIDTNEYVTTQPFAGNPNHPGTQFLLKQLGSDSFIVAPFCTEASAFQESGLNTVVCGPGSIDQAHKPDEFIDIKQLKEGQELIKRLTQRCFN